MTEQDNTTNKLDGSLARQRQATPDNALARRGEAGSLVPLGDELKAMQYWADVWFQSGMCGQHIKNATQALAIMFAARDLGLKYLPAIKGLFITNGKVQMEFQLMNALAQAKLPGYEFQVIEKTAEKCHVRGRRSPNHDWQDSIYTIKEAAQAELTGKDVWRKYGPDMLLAKAGSRLLRIIASDVLMGVSYDKDEIEEIERKPAPKTVDVSSEDIIDLQTEEETN